MGRLALFIDIFSAKQARYLASPPLREISRETVEGALPRSVAILRMLRPPAIPRDIDSRSSMQRLSGRLRFDFGWMPP